MAHFKKISLDEIYFENVSILPAGLDPVLRAVDFQIPMDQTIIVQASNPDHAVYFLEILAGRKAPHTGRVFWNEDNFFESEEFQGLTQDLVGCYFENQRAHPDQSMRQIFKFVNSLVDDRKDEPALDLADIAEHFDLEDDLDKAFKLLTYEKQKLIMLIASTLKNPQMLILEDPATGLTEKSFLQFLDWIQLGQRQGHLRHLFMTNHHPAALRHLDCSALYLEEGLVYFEENQKLKKAVHF